MSNKFRLLVAAVALGALATVGGPTAVLAAPPLVAKSICPSPLAICLPPDWWPPPVHGPVTPPQNGPDPLPPDVNTIGTNILVAPGSDQNIALLKSLGPGVSGGLTTDTSLTVVATPSATTLARALGIHGAKTFNYSGDVLKIPASESSFSRALSNAGVDGPSIVIITIPPVKFPKYCEYAICLPPGWNDDLIMPPLAK